MNVFNMEADIDYKDSKDTGVNKVLVLAFVKNVTENYANLKILIHKIKLYNIKFYLTAYLKLLLSRTLYCRLLWTWRKILLFIL